MACIGIQGKQHNKYMESFARFNNPDPYTRVLNFLILALVVMCVATAPAAFAQDTIQVKPAQNFEPVERVEKTDRGMDPMLAALYDAVQAGEPAPAGISVSTSQDGQMVDVVLELMSADSVIPQNLGIQIIFASGNMAQATVPVSNLEAIADDENVRFVWTPAQMVPLLVTPTTVDEPTNQLGYDVDALTPSEPKKMDDESSSLAYILILPAIAIPAATGLFIWQRRKSA